MRRFPPLPEVACSLGVGIAAALAFVWQRAVLGSWTCDDAGITYALAENLVRHGSFGAYPDGPAVEGYSNPVMFGLVAILIALRAFHPLSTHLTIETIEFGILAALFERELRFAARGSRVASLAGAAAFVACQLLTPATLIWYSSGLEPLQTSLSFLLLFRFVRRATEGSLRPATDGALLGACALVRPESPIYVTAAVAVAVLATPWRRSASGSRGRFALTLTIGSALGVAWLALRLSVYGFWLPNTYYAKVAGPFAENVQQLWRELLPYAGAWRFLAVGTVALAATRSTRLLTTQLALVAVSLLVPLAHGTDWMGEQRFGVPFLTMTHTICVTGLVVAIECWRRRFRTVVVLAIAVAPAAALLEARHGTARYAESGHVTLQWVALQQGFWRVELQERLGLSWPVVALPDAGGALLVGGMQLVDSASLLDFHLPRIREDGKLLGLYYLSERRVDLGESHAWSFRPLTRGEFQPVFRGPLHTFEGDRKTEAILFQAHSRHLYGPPVRGRPDAFETPVGWMAPSDETVAFAAAGARVRVEVALELEREVPTGARTLVRVAAESDALPELALSDVGAVNVLPPRGGSLRRAFLVRAPRALGTYPILLEVSAPGGKPFVRTIGELRVAGQAELAAEAARLSGPTVSLTAAQRAKRLGQLVDQSRPRLSIEEAHALWSELARTSRQRSRSDRRAFDVLLADARSWYDRPLEAPFEQAFSAIRARACDELATIWDDLQRKPAAPDERALHLAYAVDDLRRLRLRDLTACPSVRAAAAITAAAPAGLDDEATYRAALARTLLVPSDVGAQKRLLASRAALRQPFP